MACSGYLAVIYMYIHIMQELTKVVSGDESKAKIAVLRDFYMDDLLSGSSTIEKTKKLKDDISKMLQAGGFVLRKWCSTGKKYLKMIHNAKV